VESIKSKYISHFIASSALLSKAGALTSARLLPPKIGPDGSLFAGLDVQAPGFPVSFLRDQFRARSTRCEFQVSVWMSSSAATVRLSYRHVSWPRPRLRAFALLIFSAASNVSIMAPDHKFIMPGIVKYSILAFWVKIFVTVNFQTQNFVFLPPNAFYLSPE
jgi:hypothetical protein